MVTSFSDDPFPHLIVDGQWDETLLDQVFDEFPSVNDLRWFRYDNEHEIKLHGDTNCWGPATRELLGQFEKWGPELSSMFRIPDLTMETVGGGMHLIPPGGFLDMHVDFNRSPESGLYRRLNVLCYLNRLWTDSGGRLRLGRDMKIEIDPEFNRTVVFATSDESWHGHPEPTQRWRLSVAAYFFSPDPPPGYQDGHSTIWA